jgi:hypothetical protein
VVLAKMESTILFVGMRSRFLSLGYAWEASLWTAGMDECYIVSTINEVETF